MSQRFKELRELRIRTAIWLASQGYTQQEAADAMGCVASTITRDLNSIHTAWGRVVKKDKNRSSLLEIAETMHRIKMECAA